MLFMYKLLARRHSLQDSALMQMRARLGITITSFKNIRPMSISIYLHNSVSLEIHHFHEQDENGNIVIKGCPPIIFSNKKWHKIR